MHTAQVRIPFLKEDHADYAARSLNVDEELQVGKAFKECRAEGKDLVVDLKATELRILRVMISGLYDYLGIIARTLREFGFDEEAGEAR